ncbi:capsid protein, partial [Bacteroides ovatus]
MPKVTPHQLNLMTDGTVELYQELEMTIFQLIAKRLKNQSDGNINIAEWQLDKMQQLHLLNADVIRELSEIS